MRSEDGVTLVEIAVVIAILAALLAMAFAGLRSIQHNVANQEIRDRNLEESRTIVNATTRALRSATPLKVGDPAFEAADATDAIFYANLNTTERPVKVRLFIDASDRVVRHTWEPDAASTLPDLTYPVDPTTIRVIGEFAQNDASLPLFRYLDSADAQLSSIPLDDADRLKIRAVEILLSVGKPNSFGVPPSEISNIVRIQNTEALVL